MSDKLLSPIKNKTSFKIIWILKWLFEKQTWLKYLKQNFNKKQSIYIYNIFLSSEKSISELTNKQIK